MTQRNIDTLILLAGLALLMAGFCVIQIRADITYTDNVTFLGTADGVNYYDLSGGGGGGETNIPQFANSITWYRFNEFTNAAGKHVDSSAVGTNTAVPAAGAAMPTWTSAGQGIYLDGGDYSSQDCGFILNGLTGLTYSLWVSNNVFVDNAGWLMARGTTARHGIENQTAISNAVAFMDGTRTYRVFTSSANGTAWTNMNWTHICVTWVGNSNVQCYVNGVLRNTATLATATNLTISGQDDVLRIGWDDFAAGYKFNGNIDDVLIYKVPLTPAEVTNLYNFGH